MYNFRGYLSTGKGQAIQTVKSEGLEIEEEEEEEEEEKRRKRRRRRKFRPPTPPPAPPYFVLWSRTY
jgi:hypothetical protein